MKKLQLTFCVLAVILLLSGSVYSQPKPGSYDTRDGDFSAGTWSETLYGGSEGAAGNEIAAMAANYYQLNGAILDNVVLLGAPDGTERPYFEYRTIYKGGEITLFNKHDAGWADLGGLESAAYVVNLKNTIVITKKYVAADGNPTGEIEFALIVVDAEFADYPGYTASVTAKFSKGAPTPEQTTPPRFGGPLTWAIISIQGPDLINVPVDIKPSSCPNPVNVKSRGVLPVAILGTADFDVRQINLDSIRLNGVSPLRSSLEDVATPYEPFVGKSGTNACNRNGSDGYMDLGLKFDMQTFIRSLGTLTKRGLRVVGLTGELLDGTKIQGEDVINILKIW